MRSYQLTARVNAYEAVIHVGPASVAIVKLLANMLLDKYGLQASWSMQRSREPPTQPWHEPLRLLVNRIERNRTMKKNSKATATQAFSLRALSETPANGVPAVVSKEARGVVAQAKALQVTSRGALQKSADLISRIKALKAKIVEDSAEQLKAARATVKRITEAVNRKVEPLDEAIALLRGRNDAFEQDLREAAEREAEKANKAALRKEARQRRAAAAELIVQGREAEAARLLNAPSDVQEVRPEPVIVPGSVEQKRWRWRVTDIGKVNRDFLTTKDGAINALVRTMGQADENRRNEIRQLLGDGIEMEEYSLRAYETAEVVE